MTGALYSFSKKRQLLLSCYYFLLLSLLLFMQVVTIYNLQLLDRSLIVINSYLLYRSTAVSRHGGPSSYLRRPRLKLCNVMSLVKYS